MDDVLTNVSDLFLGNGIIIVIGCMLVGTIIKGSIKKIPNKFIPYINAIVAIILGFMIPGTCEGESIVSKVVILAFLGLSSVGLYEALCIAIKERFSIDIKRIYNNIVNDKSNDSCGQTLEDVPKNDSDDTEDC